MLPGSGSHHDAPGRTCDAIRFYRIALFKGQESKWHQRVQEIEGNVFVAALGGVSALGIECIVSKWSETINIIEAQGWRSEHMSAPSQPNSMSATLRRVPS